MTSPDERKPPPTTPEVLVRGIDATIERWFGGLDEAAEAKRLGVGSDAVAGLRRSLLELRAAAARASESGGAGA